MEGQESTSKKDERKTQISQGKSDGIGGVLVLGGALALASLIAIFTIKNRRRDAKKKPEVHKGVSNKSNGNFRRKKEDERREGLRFFSIDAPSTTRDSRHGTSEISVIHIDDPSELLVDTKSLILEEKPMTEISDKKESTLSGHQESSLLAPGSPILIEEKDDEDEECAMEKGEEISKGTGDSSMESNDEVWPAELIKEELSEGLNKSNGSIIFQNPEETNEEEDNTAKTEEYGSSSSCDDCDCDIFDDNSAENETTEELVMVNKQPARSSKMRFWIFSMLLLVLLMLLLSLNHHKAISYYQLYLDSSIIRGV
ncbi:uncharacterized protein LOC126707917 [Quercus robur]|uniref:uncharacterized protein LOC126707917 n=1 Tax=Quercus robur TaxID=38942 RepID=UPI0021622BB2|nr:uncharacterized protein LOC126707917 [Quercus robur]